MKNAKLTDKERQVVDVEYEKHKHDNICPHTTNPLQLKSLCLRCKTLDILGISVYQMPDKMGGDWAFQYAEIISDDFKTREDAENGALALSPLTHKK